MRNEKGQFVKGYCSSPETQFKKGEMSREKHSQWKGGRRKTANGYIMVNVLNHPRAYRNEVYEHIIVAEKKIGRYLEKGEVVHHINRIKDDNRPENLIVFSNHAEHMKQHKLIKWAKNYECCIECNKADKRHEAFGLCVRCYKKVKYHEKYNRSICAVFS